MSRKNILFVTGTDTGVGKTVFTALLLHNLRQRGRRVLAMKPFCSGSMEDVNILRELQDDQLSTEEINPFYFPDPVAPVSSRPGSAEEISEQTVLAKVEALAARCELLLVEGCGGLMVPLTKNFLLVDLITALHCRVALVAPNKLGVMNHTLLSIEALKRRGVEDVSLVMMAQPQPDISATTNGQILAELLAPVPISHVPFVPGNLADASVVRRHAHLVDPFVAAVVP